MPSVITEPGAIELTMIPFGPSSSAIARVRWMTPALAAAKAHCRRMAVTPTTEATLTMRPPPCAIIGWAAALLIR